MNEINQVCEYCDDGDGIYTHCLHCSKRESTIDKFIEDGGFDKAFNDVFGLPVGVVKALGEVS